MHMDAIFSIASLESNWHESDKQAFMQLICINGVKRTNLTHGMYDRLYLETKHTGVT